MLQGKKILIGITGSIAAYKIILLTRLLVQSGAEVKIIITPAAKDFVSPLVLSTLSKNKVLIDLFDENQWSNHVALGRWADLFLIAPLSCNTLAKMAHGICDNLLLATYLSATCPVWVAPAMDEDMWLHPTTSYNISLLQKNGVHILAVGNGELASGLFGPGRMAEPEKIWAALEVYFRGKLFNGKKILITAGPTYEAIDPVRFLGNHSSGKMGMALAEQFYLLGGDVHLVIGPTALTAKYDGITVTQIQSASQMYEACLQIFPQMDIAVMAAAVADYTPVEVATEKIKKKEEELVLHLKKTEDILKTLGAQKSPGQLLVGFALETNNELENARQKLVTKNADLIVLNSMQEPGAGFGINTNNVHILNKEGEIFASGLHSKKEIASFIIDTIVQNIPSVHSL